MTFSNNSDQPERKRILANDHANASTLHDFAQSQADEVGGRFARPTQVTGKDPATLYPKLPTCSPWSRDPVPPEPPYGQDISEPPQVGEWWEIENSLDADLGLQRLLRNPDRDRPNIPASPVCGGAGGEPATAVSPSSLSELPRLADGDLGKGPHVVEEGGVTNRRDGVGAPPSKNPSVKRRLI